MAVSTVSKRKFIIVFLMSFFVLCCYICHAQYLPGEMAAQALFCFNDKIYAGCDEEYRLTRSGNINVPPEATDLFCDGPCLAETQGVLNCINNILSDFQFYNRATVRDVRYALNAGCSNSIQRGNFNVESYMEGETSSANRPPNPILLYAIALIAWWCLLILEQL